MRDRAYAADKAKPEEDLPTSSGQRGVLFLYPRWRSVQRLLSATVNVFGVTMVMAVGLGDDRAVAAGDAVVGAAAAVDWVLKGALGGKVTSTRLGGAHGPRADAGGGWRFRSSLVYATLVVQIAGPLPFLYCSCY